MDRNFQILIAWVSMCQQDVVWKHWVEQSVIMGPVERAGAPLLSEWVGNWPGAAARAALDTIFGQDMF